MASEQYDAFQAGLSKIHTDSMTFNINKGKKLLIKGDGQQGKHPRQWYLCNKVLSMIRPRKCALLIYKPAQAQWGEKKHSGNRLT